MYREGQGQAPACNDCEAERPKDTLFCKNGLSAGARSFGPDIDFPVSFLTSDSQPMLRNVTEDGELTRRSSMRPEASEAFHDFDNLKTLRRAYLRQSAPARPENVPGDCAPPGAAQGGRGGHRN